MNRTTPTMRSFREQALHYFQRPSEGLPTAALATAAAWRGDSLGDAEPWLERLSELEVAEIDRARRVLQKRGAALQSIGRDDFPLPTLADRVAGWRRQLRDGRGFLVVRGLPVQDWGEHGASIAYWGLGTHLGVPGGQNPDEELLGHVTDYGEEAANPSVRRYRTAGDIAWHCDLADVVGLLCLSTALRGGASRIASSVTVYNELLRRRPELVARLHEPMYLDTRDETAGDRAGWVPVIPACYGDGVLRTFYHSDYFRSVVRHADVPAFTTLERDLLDTYEAIASEPGVYLDMQLEVGDIQFISNHTILHARTEYEDGPGQRRHLLRLWLSLLAEDA